MDLALDGWKLCVVHGNGPQVGDELVRNELARAEVAPLPLGVLVAATAGWIGYMVQQSLENALRRAREPAPRGDDRHAGARSHPTIRRFATPTKFIGHELTPERARASSRPRGRR